MNTRSFIYLWFDENIRDKIIDEKLKENSSFLVAWLCSVIALGKIERAEERHIELLECHKNKNMVKVFDILDEWKDESQLCFLIN